MKHRVTLERYQEEVGLRCVKGLSYRCPSTCSPKFTLRPNPIQSSTLNDPQLTSKNKEHKVGCAARSTWLKERGAVGRWEGVVAKGERGASTRETGD